MLPILVLHDSVTVFIATAPGKNSEITLSKQVSHSNSPREVFVGIGQLWGTWAPLLAKALTIGSLICLPGHLLPLGLINCGYGVEIL